MVKENKCMLRAHRNKCLLRVKEIQFLKDLSIISRKKTLLHSQRKPHSIIQLITANFSSDLQDVS